MVFTRLSGLSGVKNREVPSLNTSLIDGKSPNLIGMPLAMYSNIFKREV